jgi:hypothetical protein
MSRRFFRCTFMLPNEQKEFLEDEAKSKMISTSAVLRQMIDYYRKNKAQNSSE